MSAEVDILVTLSYLEFHLNELEVKQGTNNDSDQGVDPKNLRLALDFAASHYETFTVFWLAETGDREFIDYITGSPKLKVLQG